MFKNFQPFQKSCPVCGDLFLANSPTHNYCSRLCAGHGRNYKRRINWEFLDFQHAGWRIQWNPDLTFVLTPPISHWAKFPEHFQHVSPLPYLTLEFKDIVKKVTVAFAFEFIYGLEGLFMIDAAHDTWNCKNGFDCPDEFWDAFFRRSKISPHMEKCGGCNREFLNIEANFWAPYENPTSHAEYLMCLDCQIKAFPF